MNEQPPGQVDQGQRVPRHPASTAGLLIEVIPTGVPGAVQIVITDVGPNQLTSGEAAVLLQQAEAIARADVGAHSADRDAALGAALREDRAP